MAGRFINDDLGSILKEARSGLIYVMFLHVSAEIRSRSSQYKYAALSLYQRAWIQLSLLTVVDIGKMCKLSLRQ